VAIPGGYRAFSINLIRMTESASMMAKPTKVVKKSVPFATAYSFLFSSTMPFLISPLFTPTTIITKRTVMDDVSMSDHSLEGQESHPFRLEDFHGTFGAGEVSAGVLPNIFLSSSPCTTSSWERRWANSSKTFR